MTFKTTLSIALWFAVQSTALAQPAGDRAAAEAVFREGRELMEREAWNEACPKFEKSLALYQSASAALNLARCYAKQGRLAAAQTTLDRAIELNRRTEDPERRKELERLAVEDRKIIEPRVPHVRVVVSPEVAGTVVERNGIEVPRPLLGQPLPVDPGSFTIRVAAPGYKEFAQTSKVTEGQTVVVEIRLARADETVDGKGPPIVKAPQAKASEAPLSIASEGAVWPWIVGGVGVATLGVGVGFAVDYGVVRSDLDTLCPEGACPGSKVGQASDLLVRWDRDLALMTSFGAAGAGLLVTAAIGLAVDGDAPPQVQFVPLVSPHYAGLSVTTTY